MTHHRPSLLGKLAKHGPSPFMGRTGGESSSTLSAGASAALPLVVQPDIQVHSRMRQRAGGDEIHARRRDRRHRLQPHAA
jgi:hypothetical protein